MCANGGLHENSVPYSELLDYEIFNEKCHECVRSIIVLRFVLRPRVQVRAVNPVLFATWTSATRKDLRCAVERDGRECREEESSSRVYQSHWFARRMSYAIELKCRGSTSVSAYLRESGLSIALEERVSWQGHASI